MNPQELLQSNLWIAAGLLAGIAGALLALGCDVRTNTPDVSATAVEESAPEVETAMTVGVTTDKDLADLEKEVVEAERGAKREIEQARENSEKIPVAARERLAAAIERTEDARDDASDRLDELKESGAAHWDARRARVVEALGELEEARREVVAALAGGEPSRSDG